MEKFTYYIPTKVYFGKNQLEHLGPTLAKYGKKVLLTYGGGSIKKIGLYDKIMAELNKAGLEVFELSGIEPNPRIESVRAGAQICKDKNIDVVLAVGGGSTIDASKFIAAGACTDTDPWDFFTKRAPIDKALPLVTILTLAATGSEMDAGGVVSNMETKDKLSRMSPHMLPKVSFLDPTNTYTVSKFQTACGSVDILSHIIEQYFKWDNMYMLDTVMEGLMKTVIKYAPIAIKEPDNYEARANLMWASSWAINGFISGGGRIQPWSCHPIEHELSAIYDITHGLGLAILTPRWMEYCLDETTEERFYQFGVNVFDLDKDLPHRKVAEEAIRRLSDFFFGTLGLDSTLTAVGIKAESIPVMAKKSCGGGDAINGYKKLTPEDVEKILKMCL